MMAMSNDSGLRERKKQATRLAISDVATRLFIDRGFDNVTIAEIADAANVAKMTVFNYFPRKEDLFFDRDDESRALIREALARRPSGQSPIDAIRALARQLAEENHPFTKITAGTAKFWQTVRESLALSHRARELRDMFVADLAKMLAEAVGQPRKDPLAHLLASLLVATWTTAYIEGLRQHRTNATHEAIKQTLDAVIERGFEGAAAAMRGTPYE
jgi:AcrR family transcriptional regulator